VHGASGLIARVERAVAAAVRRAASGAPALVFAVVGLVGSVRAAHAQSTDFLLSTAPVTFPTPRLEQFSSWPPSATGPVTDSVAVPFSVSRRQNLSLRIASVLVRCTGTTGGKPCADIEWRSGPVGAWRPLTLTDEVVESRTMIPLLVNETWSGVLWLRVRISWDDPAPSVMTSGVALTLSVYRP
jgi:hypothetical protein